MHNNFSFLFVFFFLLISSPHDDFLLYFGICFSLQKTKKKTHCLTSVMLFVNFFFGKSRNRKRIVNKKLIAERNTLGLGSRIEKVLLMRVGEASIGVYSHKYFIVVNKCLFSTSDIVTFHFSAKLDLLTSFSANGMPTALEFHTYCGPKRKCNE